MDPRRPGNESGLAPFTIRPQRSPCAREGVAVDCPTGITCDPLNLALRCTARVREPHMREETYMATFPLPDEQEAIDLTVLGQRVTDDLSLYYLPGEAVDFVVEGSNAYLVQFENPAVFGTSFATLNMGNN